MFQFLFFLNFVQLWAIRFEKKLFQVKKLVYFDTLQARETLRVMMERQKQQRLDTADKLNK